jgi:hypothetical protein
MQQVWSFEVYFKKILNIHSYNCEIFVHDDISVLPELHSAASEFEDFMSLVPYHSRFQ